MIKLFSKTLVDNVEVDILKRAIALSTTGVLPSLVAVVCSSNPAALSYVESKRKRAVGMSIPFRIEDLSGIASTDEGRARIAALSEASDVGGILLELPLREEIDEYELLDVIDPAKDVDGLGRYHIAALARGRPVVVPATPAACMELIRQACPIEGKDVVIIGRGPSVGRPLASAMIAQGATVSVCHSKTKEIERFTRVADIVVSATGTPHRWSSQHFRDGAIIIDAGIGFINGRLAGDVYTDSLAERDVTVTPVPGGVGPLTTALIFRNFLDLVEGTNRNV